ncbi:MAG: hypothetical protein GEV05_04940 [Betaproteobacteria bacterium]|nr:hypothetical protein [Betaproteobacteria bacterium]
MPQKTVDAPAVRRLLAQLRGHAVTEERAEQLALDIAQVNEAARAEGAKNDFNDEPSRFGVTLTRLATR